MNYEEAVQSIWRHSEGALAGEAAISHLLSCEIGE